MPFFKRNMYVSFLKLDEKYRSMRNNIRVNILMMNVKCSPRYMALNKTRTELECLL